MITEGAIYNVGGPLLNKIQRRSTLDTITSIALSPFADDFFVINLSNTHAYVYDTNLKTEIISIIALAYQEKTGNNLQIQFTESLFFPFSFPSFLFLPFLFPSSPLFPSSFFDDPPSISILLIQSDWETE